MKTRTFKIKGLTTLIQHNGRLANPLDPITKQMKTITAKRVKTDEDYEDLAKLEAMGGLYYSDESGVHIPGEVIEATLYSASKLQKLGTTFKRGAQVMDFECPLIYKGPKTPEELSSDPEHIFAKLVKIQKNRILRTRPCFKEWGIDFTVSYNPTQLNEGQIDQIVQDAGELIGMCDYRPRYGKFEVVSVN